MTLSVVMAGLVPAIHVFDQTREKDVDARDKRGHDESNIAQLVLARRYQGVIAGCLPQMYPQSAELRP
jgi:hypothetical protein